MAGCGGELHCGDVFQNCLFSAVFLKVNTNMTFKVLNKKVSERKCEVSFGEFRGGSLARRGSAGPVNTAVCWPPPTAVI